VAHQAAAFVTTRSHCEACGARLQRKRKKRPAAYAPSSGPYGSPVLDSITVGVRCTRPPPSGR
jgi:hypothetical protein